MNSKRLLVFITFSLSVIATCIMLNVMALFSVDKYFGLIFASIIFAVCGIITCILRKQFYFIATFINSLATGIAISSLYVHLQATIAIVPTIIASFAFIALFGLYCLLSFLSFFKNHPIISIIIYFILVAAAVTTVMVLLNNSSYAFIPFLLIPFLTQLIVLICDAENINELAKNTAIASFSVLIFVILIVFLIISEGDGADALDIFPDGGTSKKKKDPYRFNL